jgi:hypothetical protein
VSMAKCVIVNGRAQPFAVFIELPEGELKIW